MKNLRSKRKLTLNTETIRALRDVEVSALRHVHGGRYGSDDLDVCTGRYPCVTNGG
jgi:hypothetical protein